MAYNNSIPQQTDLISQSQVQILENFSQLDLQYGTSGDHVEFTATSNNGKHKKVSWVDQSGAPPSSVAGDVVAYSVNRPQIPPTATTITMPYYKKDALVTEYALSPIKAYGTISVTNNTTATLLDGFNINTLTANFISGVNSVIITFLDPMRTDTNYGILLTSTGGVNTNANCTPMWYINSNYSTTTVYFTRILPYPVTFTFAALEF